MGGDLLREFSPVMLHLKLLKMEFVKDGKQIEINRIKDEAQIKSMTKGRFEKMLKVEDQMFITQMAQVFS